MSFLEEYKQKLVSADEAVKIIKSGDWVNSGTAKLGIFSEKSFRNKSWLKGGKHRG